MRRSAKRLTRGKPLSWNTYIDHPVGYHLDDISIDIWGEHGRGDPIIKVLGDVTAKHAIDRHKFRPIKWLIWNRRIWYPGSGWHEDHVHITFNQYSRVAGRFP